MEIKEAYQTLKKYLSKEFVEGRTTEDVLLSAENSWMMPSPWFFAAAAFARDDDREGFKKALTAASACYGEILARNDPEDVKDMKKESDATDTLAKNVEEAWKLVIADP